MGTWQTGLVTRVLFPAPTPSYTIDSFPGELIWIPALAVGGSTVFELGESSPAPTVSSSRSTEEGEVVPCLLLPCESARFLIIFFHSNAEDLGRCRWFAHFLRDQFQVHILAVEYPGYGVCPGTASQESVVATAEAALSFVVQSLHLPLEQIKVFGRSIGTAPALHLASRHHLAGLILVTPFKSVKTLFQDRAGPLSLLVEEWFDNQELIGKVRCPTMFLHGQKDTIIPWEHSEALYALCSSRKLFINPPEMEHNTNLTTDISNLVVPMFRFFPLPDYSFTELKVPAWCYDKRRSHLYVRPSPQVRSSASITDSDLASRGGGLLLPPRGDDDAIPHLDQAADVQPPSAGDVAAPKKTVSEALALTQPTVLHIYRATKQYYSFEGESRFAARREADEEGDDEPPHHAGMMRAMRRKPMGDHFTASAAALRLLKGGASPKGQPRAASRFGPMPMRCGPGLIGPVQGGSSQILEPEADDAEPPEIPY